MVCVVQHEAKQIRGLDTPNFPAKIRCLPMCYVCSRSKLKHISRLKCLEGTHAAVAEIVCACDCGWERVRGLQAKCGRQLPFPAVVLCQKNEIQFTSEPDSSHELRNHNPRPFSVEQAASASAASSWARSISPVSIAFLAD